MRESDMTESWRARVLLALMLAWIPLGCGHETGNAGRGQDGAGGGGGGEVAGGDPDDGDGDGGAGDGGEDGGGQDGNGDGDGNPDGGGDDDPGDDGGDDGGGDDGGEGEGEGGEGEGGEGEGEGEGEVPGPECRDDALEEANCSEILECSSECGDEACVDDCLECGVASARLSHEQLALCALDECDGDETDLDCVCERCRDEALGCGLEAPCAEIAPECNQCRETQLCLGEAERDPRAQEECFESACENGKIALANALACASACGGERECMEERCADAEQACGDNEPEQQLSCSGMFVCIQTFCVVPGGMDQGCALWCQSNMSAEGTRALQPFLTCLQREGCANEPDPGDAQACIEDNCGEENAACFGLDPPEPVDEGAACTALRVCVDGCEDRGCERLCERDVDDETRESYFDFVDCLDDNGCDADDEACIGRSCAEEAAACPPEQPEVPEGVACDEIHACAQACERCVEADDCELEACLQECEDAGDEDAAALYRELAECAAEEGCNDFDVDCAAGECPEQAAACGVEAPDPPPPPPPPPGDDR